MSSACSDFNSLIPEPIVIQPMILADEQQEHTSNTRDVCSVMLDHPYAVQREGVYFAIIF